MRARPDSESPQLRILPLSGVALAVWEWPGADDESHPPLVLVHATGFHGRLWDSILRQLPGRRALAIELRGHGRSGKPDPPYHWRALGGDVAELAGLLGLRGAIGVGHSSGGHAITLAAALAPESFRTLLLIDPTIFPVRKYSEPKIEASFTLRRKNQFQSPAEMVERFQARAPFAAWNPAVLRDYCEFGLLPADGHFVLACPPAVEASIYAESNAPESNIYAEVGAITQTVTVLRGGMERRTGHFDLGASPTAPDLAAHFAHGRDVMLEGRSHYIPMEVPERVAEELEKLGV